MVEKNRKTIKEKYENFRENPVLCIKKSFSKIKLSYIFYALLSLISGILIGGIWVFSSRGGEGLKPWSDLKFWFSDDRIWMFSGVGVIPLMFIFYLNKRLSLSDVFYSVLSCVSGILIGGIWVFSSRGGENQKPWSDLQFWFSDIRIVCLGVIGCTLQLFFISQKEKLNYIGKIIYYIVPLFTFIISIGIWTLVWSKYDGTWSNIQQGIITVFAGLIGAIGVFVTVAVNYENHEQNRNIQSEIERKRRKTEQKIENTRRDNETIKDLNERLHEILKNRHDSDDGVRASSYFQLAGLYKDWGLLGKNSKIIEAQRKVQQKNILKLIFGTVSQTEEQEQKKNARSFLEIRTLNSVIADIFPKVSDTDEYKESFEPFDLQYADLSGLTFDEVFFPDRSILSHADFICSSLQGVNLQCARLQGVNLQNAELWRADLQDADLQDADLLCADLQGANLRGANFQNTELLLADLPYANLQDANLWRANLQNAKLWNADLWNAKLWNADLQGADLQNAKLQNAKLQGADLQSADLQSADLQDADLQNAKLQGADLQSADLQGADLQSADLQDADLQSADLQDANLYGTAERLSSEQLAQAQNIESVETREWDWDFYEYGEEDRALKNLIQEALKIQEVRKNNPPQNS